MKKVFVLLLVLLLVSLACSLSQAANRAAALSGQLLPTLTPTATRTATAALCVIATGLQSGRVNLRSCAGVACGVSSVLTEGQPLTLLQAGAWSQVRTGAGVTGYINSKFCK